MLDENYVNYTEYSLLRIVLISFYISFNEPLRKLLMLQKKERNTFLCYIYVFKKKMEHCPLSKKCIKTIFNHNKKQYSTIYLYFTS